MKTWNKSIWTGLIFGFFAAAYLIAAFGVQTATKRFGIFDGGFMPKIYGSILLLCAIVQLVSGIKQHNAGLDVRGDITPEQVAENRISNRNVIACFVLIFLYIFSMKTLGFMLSSAIFLFCLCNLLLPKSKPRTKKLMLGFGAFSVVLPVATYVFFKNVVYMALPVGTLIRAIMKLF